MCLSLFKKRTLENSLTRKNDTSSEKESVDMVPINEKLIAIGHPNRPGTKLEALKAVIFHYTNNDRAWSTDLANAAYFGRKFIRQLDANGVQARDPKTNMKIIFEEDGKTPWSYGSTQVIADMDSITIAVPLDEAAWSTGDAWLSITNGFKGQQPIAGNLFNFRQNYQTIGIEMCNNDVIKNSDEDWNKSVANAADWTVQFLLSKKLRVNVEKSLDPQKVTELATGEVLLLRHYDLSGKMCPAPMVKNPDAWRALVMNIANRVNGPTIEM